MTGREMALQAYRWTFSLCLVIVIFLVAVPLSLYFHKYYSDGINEGRRSPLLELSVGLIPAAFLSVVVLSQL